MVENDISSNKMKEMKNISKTELDKCILYKNIVIKFCIIWTILIGAILLLIKNADKLGLDRAIFLLIWICIYIVAYIPKNIKRLEILIKYTKQQVDEIEKTTKIIGKENCFADTYLFDNYVLKVEKNYFEIIKYNDILWILKEVYYSRRPNGTKEFNFWRLGYKNYGELIFITKDKKIHEMGFSSKETILKEKILKKNPNILFGRSEAIIKKAKQIYKLNINTIDLKNTIKDYMNIALVLVLICWIFL